MKKIIAFLLFTACTSYAQNMQDLIIDSKLIKSDDLLWDLETLSKSPEIQLTGKKGKVQTLLYKSVNYQGKPTQVFAYYCNPDLLAGKPSGKNKFPGIVLIHGGGGKAFKVWVEKWAAEGYAAIAMDLAGNGEDGKKLVLAGPDQGDEDKFAKMENGNLKDVWTYHAVASAILAHSLLLNLPEVDASRTCVTGISWGGYLTCIVASLDNRFKAAAPVYGCGFYDESDVFKFPLQQLSPDNQSKWMKHFDPSSYLAFAKPGFLFVNGNKDKFYNVVPYDKTYRLIPENQRTICIIPNMPHGHESGWEPHEIRYFFESMLNHKSQVITVNTVLKNSDSLNVSYSSPVSLWHAEFYYSNDTASANEQRVWNSQKVVINPEKQTISCPIPKEGFKYGFFYLKDHRNISTSSEFIIN
ncbi:S9 family peptidase [Dyadobacter sp. NIV53]|uniref:alpha/beta hydrolase family protein n=1 Tax=Dyadobacter sp. NIV53 TaxID=2861765 RepID=UPI001C878136|nr:alpha/beta fold hydrolase [Dyadobacter sp. NIV53]